MRNTSNWLRSVIGKLFGVRRMAEPTPTDMLDLPPAQLKIMRLMLRQREMAYTDLISELERQPSAEQLSRLELDVNLRQLVEIGWLLREESAERVLFRIGQITSAAMPKPDQPTEASGAAQPIGKPSVRHDGGRERLSNFWDVVDEVAAEQPSRPKVGIRTGLAEELSAGAETPAEQTRPARPKVVGKLFEELSAKPDDSD